MKGKYKNKKTGEIIEVYKYYKGWYSYKTPNKSRGMILKSHLKENFIKIS